MYKATLILEGGATRGVFTAGVLDYLTGNNLRMSHIIAVSAGACNAVDYVTEQQGRTKRCMIPTDKSTYYYHGFRKFVKKRSVMNMDLIFDAFPNRIYPFNFDEYFQSEKECEIVTTNCITGKAEYMTERENRERLLKICRASCSMPLLSPIVNIDGIPYLDGGITDAIPIQRALAIGNEKIVVVLTRNRGYRKKNMSRGVAELYKRSYRSYPHLVQSILSKSANYNNAIRKVEKLEDEGKIFVIRPAVKPIARMERNSDVLQVFYEHGGAIVERNYEALVKYLKG